MIVRFSNALPQPVDRLHFVLIQFVFACLGVDGDKLVLVGRRQIGANLALDQRVPAVGEDRIAVAAFTRRFFIICNFTTDHKLLKDRIGDIKNRHSGTAYYDAMWATLDLLEEANTARKAIVVLTDGVDNSLDHPDDAEFDPRHGFDDLLARTVEADATIYPVYLDTEYETIGARGRDGHAAYVTARRQLQALAEQTGALMFKAEQAEDLEGVYQQVAAELHSLYSMAYAPKFVGEDGKWRKITVAVDLAGARVRTKRGYFAR